MESMWFWMMSYFVLTEVVLMTACGNKYWEDYFLYEILGRLYFLPALIGIIILAFYQNEHAKAMLSFKRFITR